MGEVIRGSVAKVLDSRSLVINRGSEDGVAEGMVFEVLDKKATNVKDPETGKVLGSIDRPKIRVKVALLEKKLAVAETYVMRTVNKGGSGSLGISGLLAAPRYVEEVETLKAKEKEWEDLPEEESIVQVGDPVRSVDTVKGWRATSSKE